MKPHFFFILTVVIISPILGNNALADVNMTPINASHYPATPTGCELGNVGIGTAATDAIKAGSINQYITLMHLSDYGAVGSSDVDAACAQITYVQDQANQVKACKDRVNQIKRWQCIASACATMGQGLPTVPATNTNTSTDTSVNTSIGTDTGTDTSTGAGRGPVILPGSGTDKGPVVQCSGGRVVSDADLHTRLDNTICQMLDNSTPDTRSAVLAATGDAGWTMTENDLVEYGAYVKAAQGHGDLCQADIKAYLGAYVPVGGVSRWNFNWYRALAGCSILTGGTVVSQQENFRHWYNYLLSIGGANAECGAINGPLQEPCTKLGAPSPIPN